jgi:polyisoprenoid-binding protein YceI
MLATTALALATEIDGVASRVGFSMQTRWGQLLEGRFPTVHGEVSELPDGRHQVRLLLSTRDVEIVGHPGYTRFARGGGFFDADHWPQVEFLSDAYAPALLQQGGPLTGTLRIRGIHRREVFVIRPATCAQPGLACDVAASGSIRRSDYGMGRWKFAMSEDVGFSLRMRVRADGGA